MTLAIVLVVASAVNGPHAAQSVGAPAAVRCRVLEDARGREFALRQAPPEKTAGDAVAARWQLAMREASSKEAWIAIQLPGAKPVVTATSATLSYHNANGGRQVDLEVSPEGSRLDVWVDYGLEVNIEPDLDPRVDRLNTDGPLTTLKCSIDFTAVAEHP